MWTIVAVLIVGAYFFRLGEVPPGLFIDETSVGYNARSILHTGADEYGTRWPLFFRALEDYKSPLFVYATVLTVGPLGPTPFALRLAPALFALGSGVVFFFLIRRITGRPRLARWLAVLALVAPTTFCYGRHAVSEASTVGLMLGLAFLAFERWAAAPSAARAGVTGFALAACTYSYTTQRMFAPLMIVVAGCCAFFDVRLRRTLWAFIAAAAAGLGPYAGYLLLHPGTLTKRFDSMSVFCDHAPLSLAAARFTGHYLEHAFSLDFLFRTGDPNLRHNVGIGLLPLWMMPVLVLGLVALWRRRQSACARFYLALFPLVPIPVALTHEAWPHATRMIHLFPLALLTAALAISDWIERDRPRRTLLALLICGALLEGGQFLHRYFGDYPGRAQMAFDRGEDEAVRIALAARKGNEGIYAPETFFAFNGIRFKFFADLDPVQVRAQGLTGLGFFPLNGATSMPSNSIFIVEGEVGQGGQAGRLERLGVSRSVQDGTILWSVCRLH